jgi:hypothetical protein
MDAFEINKIIQHQIRTVQELKIPLIQENKPLSVSPKLINDTLCINIDQSQSTFPWDEVIILCGVAVLIIIVINEIQKSQNYNSFTRRRKVQHSIYQ